MIKIELETGGSVWKVLTKPGDQVEAGDTLFILEVMKMEVLSELLKEQIHSYELLLFHSLNFIPLEKL